MSRLHEIEKKKKIDRYNFEHFILLKLLLIKNLSTRWFIYIKLPGIELQITWSKQLFEIYFFLSLIIT